MTSPFKNSALALTTCMIATLAGGQLFAQGDVAAGEKVFKRCKACHQIGDGAKNRSGPILTNTAGNAAGAVEGYKYSKALAAAAENGLVWSDENLIKWLENPSNFMKEYLGDDSAKSKMSFKLKKPEDAANVIAYLASFSQAADASDTAPAEEPKEVVDHAEDAHGDALFQGPGMRTAEESKLAGPGDDGYEIAEYSTEEDLAFMEKVIAAMKERGIWSGEDAIHTPVYPGVRPHGILLETIYTKAEIDGRIGELIVKRSFEHPDAEDAAAKAITEVQADPDKYLHNYAIMFKREDGYQDAHQNWYYAEFDPQGAAIDFEGNTLVGRNDLCVSCHVLADGDDYLFTKDLK